MGTPGILDGRLQFPDPRQSDDNGLVAVGGDLSMARLRLAYRSGLFPWSVNPISWWSPDPRGVFELDLFHLPGSFAKFLRRQPFTVTINRAFRAVIEACATADRKGVWISPEFIEAYTRLHESGDAHSVECWQDDQLVGGIYGVHQGGLFAGESMFHRATNASKVALWHLVQRLRVREFPLFDIQMVTPVTRQFGAVEISRDEYLRRLAGAVEMNCSFV
ncbi:MAG TPA: leucyl/phenylalanyl-tRNA--protein transferase [Verrucomicrobiae bacterium]|nr:leucyl/phenylalanyl-tRNA--protein transferase [Verrucomicrobiae bacterium]